MLAGGIAKALSIIAKIIMARKISTLAISVYSLTAPTMILLLNIAQLGIPTTISKLIAKGKYSKLKIMQVSLLILLISDLLIGTVYIFLVPTIANTFLKNSYTLLTLYGIVFLLPLVSVSSLLKGYFIGTNQIEKSSSCQISEELARIVFILLFIDLIQKDHISLLSFFAMFSTIVGELASLIHLLLSLKFDYRKNKTRFFRENQQNSTIKKEILASSLPTISTRIIGSAIFFIEPIIYTSLMLKNGIDHETMTIQYGIINSYIFPLLLLPGFLSNALSMYLLPKLSLQVEMHQYQLAKKNFLSVCLFSIGIGFFFLGALFCFPDFFMNLLYGKTDGVEYIRRYGFYLLLYYLQSPLHIAMISFNKEKYLLYESLLCNALRIALFFLFIPKYGIDGLVIAILISTYLSLFMDIFEVFKSFMVLKNESQLVLNKKA